MAGVQLTHTFRQLSALMHHFSIFFLQKTERETQIGIEAFQQEAAIPYKTVEIIGKLRGAYDKDQPENQGQKSQETETESSTIEEIKETAKAYPVIHQQQAKIFAGHSIRQIKIGDHHQQYDCQYLPNRGFA